MFVPKKVVMSSSILQKFNTEDNFKTITGQIQKQLRYDTNANEIIVYVAEYANNWVSLGKFDKYEEYYDSLLKFYNNLFIQTFVHVIANKLTKGEPDFNPFKDTINGKKIADYDVEDYRNMLVQSTYDDTVNPLYYRDNSIPYHKQMIHHRHYEKNNSEGLYLSGNEAEGLQYNRNLI